MGHTITVRLTKELAGWLEATAKRTGISQGEIVRQQLEQLKTGAGQQPFMRLAGCLHGPRDLSQRRGFSRS